MIPNNAPVAMLDSGVGGLPYLESARRLLPTETFAYVADTRHFPYGTRDPRDLRNVIEETAIRLTEALAPKVLVLACNTASVVALGFLRTILSIPIVGVVPAVKPAAQTSRNRRIGLLATNRTVLDSYTEDLIRQFASDCHIERVGDGQIVSFVEERFLDADEQERRHAVSDACRRFISAGIDTIVIGCTHFIYVEPELAALLPDSVAIVDSREGVALQLKRVVAQVGPSDTRGADTLHVTDSRESETRLRRFARKFDLAYAGML